MSRPASRRADHSLISASLPDALVETLDPARLPTAWNSWSAPPEVQRVGDDWALRNETLALEVPSAVVPGGSTLLINPAHADFGRLEVERAQPFQFDPRLVG